MIINGYVKSFILGEIKFFCQLILEHGKLDQEWEHMLTQSVINVDLLREWIREAGRIALSQLSARRVDIKPDLTPVTDVDRQIETFLLEKITRYYPDHGVLAEEGSNRSGNEFIWIIDPIDGTRAFASGLPLWGISVGVFRQGQPYAGVFYMPRTGDMFWGTVNESFYNEQRLIPLTNVNLRSPIAFIAVPSNAHLEYAISFPRLRSLGSTAAHLAYVASGWATAAITRRISIWDLASVLPALTVSQSQLLYLISGKPMDLSDFLDGGISPEPLIVAHSSIIDDVRALVKIKTVDPIYNKLT